MKNAPMRFCGLSLHHNPHTLRIESRAGLRELISPCCTPDSENLGLRLRVVSGEGELYGADCLAQFRRLEALQEAQKRGKLVLPHRQPMLAYLREIVLIAEPTENVVRYRFVFLEAQRESSGRDTDCYIALAGDSLWDIGFRFGVGIDELVALNPQIPYIDDLTEGMKVRLC